MLNVTLILFLYHLRRPFESLAGIVEHQVEDLITFFGEDNASYYRVNACSTPFQLPTALAICFARP